MPKISHNSVTMDGPTAAIEIRKSGGWWIDVALILGILATLVGIFFSPPVYRPIANHFAKQRLAAAVEKGAPGFARRSAALGWVKIETNDRKTFLGYAPKAGLKNNEIATTLYINSNEYVVYGHFDDMRDIGLDSMLELGISDLITKNDLLSITYVSPLITPTERLNIEEELILILKGILEEYNKG